MKLLDVRHEQTAVFAAEAVGKLTRVPGLAVLTAGPGITNGVSPITQAYFSGSPLVVVGGRAPANRWGQGSLQELDHVPLVAPVTKSARTAHRGRRRRRRDAPGVHLGPHLAPRPGVPRRPARRVLRQRHGGAAGVLPRRGRGARPRRDQRPSRRLLAEAERPVLVLGSDVWLDGAEESARRLVETAGLPAARQRHGARHHPRRPRRCWSPRPARSRSAQADLVVVVGTPLDFRLSYGVFGGKEGAPPAQVRARRRLRRPRSSGHAELAASAYGDLSKALDGVLTALGQQRQKPDWSSWVARAPGHRQGRRGARPGAARRRGRPHPPGADLRRAAAAAGRRLGRHRRRRRLRLLRRQVRRAAAARRLARPRPLRLPRRRHGRRHRGPDRAALGAGRGAASATVPPACR